MSGYHMTITHASLGWGFIITDARGNVVARSWGYFLSAQTAEELGRWSLARLQRGER